MKLNLEINKIDNKTLILVDRTKWYNSVFPNKIYSIVLDIVSSVIPNGGTYNVDVLDYLSKNRIDYELFRVTSETLGMPAGFDIPDGIYYFTIKVNNLVTIKQEVVVLSEVIKEMKALSILFGSDIEITSDDIVINTNVSNSLIAKWYYTVGLYYKLIMETSKPQNYVVINNDLDKLQRALLIIKRTF